MEVCSTNEVLISINHRHAEACVDVDVCVGGESIWNGGARLGSFFDGLQYEHSRFADTPDGQASSLDSYKIPQCGKGYPEGRVASRRIYMMTAVIRAQVHAREVVKIARVCSL